MAATREQDTGAAPGREASGPASGQAGDTSEREQLRLKEEAAELGRLGEDLLGWFRDSLALLGTEARLFLATLLLVVALAAMVGLLIAGAWVFLGAAAVLMLVREGGVNPALATFAGAAVLTVTAVLVYAWIRRLARELGFARTRAGWAALFRADGRHAARKKEE